jgi:hypothetical protein
LVWFQMDHLDTSYKGQYITRAFINVEPPKSEITFLKFMNPEFMNYAVNFEDAIVFKPDNVEVAGVGFDICINLNKGGTSLLRPGCSVGFYIAAEGLSTASFLSPAVPIDQKLENLCALIEVQGLPGAKDTKSRRSALLGARWDPKPMFDWLR